MVGLLTNFYVLLRKLVRLAGFYSDYKALLIIAVRYAYNDAGTRRKSHCSTVGKLIFLSVNIAVIAAFRINAAYNNCFKRVRSFSKRLIMRKNWSISVNKPSEVLSFINPPFFVRVSAVIEPLCHIVGNYAEYCFTDTLCVINLIKRYRTAFNIDNRCGRIAGDIADI